MRRLLATLAVATAAVSFAPPASACAGEVCEAINVVCDTVTGRPCVR